MDGSCQGQGTTDKKIQYGHRSTLKINEVSYENSYSTMTEFESSVKKKKKRHIHKRRESCSEAKDKSVHTVPKSENELAPKRKKHKRKKENEYTECSGTTPDVTIAESKIERHIINEHKNKHDTLNSNYDLEFKDHVVIQTDAANESGRRKKKKYTEGNTFESNYDMDCIGKYPDQMRVIETQNHKKNKCKIEWNENTVNETKVMVEEPKIAKHIHRASLLDQNDKIDCSGPIMNIKKYKHRKKHHSPEPSNETEFNENNGMHSKNKSEKTKRSKKTKHRKENSVLKLEEYTADEIHTVSVVPEICERNNEVKGTVHTNEEPKKKKKKEKVAKEKKKQDSKVKDETFVQKKALDYLKRWYTDRKYWKFEKLRQIWLQDNMLQSSKIPSIVFPILLEYISSAKGNTRKVIQDRCLKVVHDVEQWMELTEQGLGEAEILVKLPGSKKVDEETYTRARALMQCLQDENAVV